MADGTVTHGVSLSDVRKSFGPLEVVHGVSISIAGGEFVVLVGPSGCGKSTLLRMIAGLEETTGGEIRIGDRVVNDLPPKQRDIAMVFQNYALYPHMTVAQNMGFSLQLRRWDKKLIRERVQKSAEILALTELLERYPRQLSGGQRQRVAMGRAIVRDPKVFLFDEPLSNLDAKLRVQMRTEIKELHLRLKTTVIYVTHDQIEAMTMADKIVVMRDGHVEQIGAPLDLYDRPANLFVAGFIGSPAMNFIDGVVDASGSAPVVRTAEGIVLPLGLDTLIGGSQSVTFGVRPEHLELAPEGDHGALPAVVKVVEPTGAETLVFAKVGAHDVTAVFRERYSVSPGDRISLRPKPEHAHYFDDAGKRIRAAVEEKTN